MTILSNRLAFFLSFLLVAACGSSKSNGTGGGDVVALCKQGCAKSWTLCGADTGVPEATFKSICESTCTTTGPQQGQTCTNASELMAAYQTCQGKTTCTDYTTCLESIPPCTGSTATGGSSGGGTGGRAGGGTGGRAGGGTGGSTGGGTGGGGGATAGTACADLLACCNASTNPTIRAACMAEYSSVMAMGNDACAQVLAAGQSTICP